MDASSRLKLGFTRSDNLTHSTKGRICCERLTPTVNAMAKVRVEAIRILLFLSSEKRTPNYNIYSKPFYKITNYAASNHRFYLGSDPTSCATRANHDSRRAPTNQACVGYLFALTLPINGDCDLALHMLPARREYKSHLRDAA